MLYCRRLLVGIDALASILAIGLDERTVSYCRRLLVGIDVLACILAIGLNRSTIPSSTLGWN